MRRIKAADYADGRGIIRFRLGEYGSAPVCGMTTRVNGSMRFRLNEQNPLRDSVLAEICGGFSRGDSAVPVPAAVELVHSRTVFAVDDAAELSGKKGDGIITVNRMIVPVVTVADCMPVWLHDPVSGVFGVVHSGWKGTGIAADAISAAAARYGARPENFHAALGPHIRDCCYIVDSVRAGYFISNFSAACASPLEPRGECFCGGRGLPSQWNSGDGRLYRLSLEKANLALLLSAGVRDENITVCTDCTCCDTMFGSNRRETAETGMFTVQAAFICGNLL